MNARERTIQSLRSARELTHALLNGMNDEQASHQLFENDHTVVWNLGHLAWSNAWIAGLLDGEPLHLPDVYAECFGYQSEPNTTAAYPSFADVRTAADTTMDRLIAAVEHASDEKLASAPPDDLGGFASDLLDAASKMAWHEGWHAGQISSIRRAVGLGPAFGGG